ncbi:sensor histidine kinase [Lyngbya confervoides]|uniref:histidine kinase n=1 Tax=Lyngbya confervoides BDU141951 TaxID=1574623 RepID=A0ABD4T853_9CYAN|nr:hybrid sensor histidine kinase/response regulator [Lyngbya confervoides]MCM1984918.1 ATP-binding protein [Lyngbya confervoides BDU141951]
MSHDALQLLLVEDNRADAYLLRKLLVQETQIQLTHCEDLRAALHSLDQHCFDAILLDLSLPDSSGLETVKAIQQANPETPILVLTGLDDEAVAIAALREGAQDYLPKGELQRSWLIRAIHYAIERQQNLDQLQHLNQELVRSNQELEQFAYVVSHDLQQPLQVVLGFAGIIDALYGDRPDEPIHQYVGDIINASKHMSRLIRDLLHYSRINSAPKPVECVDCEAVLDQVLLDLQPAIHRTQATITTDPLPTIYGNETQLGQLFQNLLSNAIKYQPAGQRPRIHISAVQKQGEWIFGVQDNGIGIAAADAHSIFQIFHRLHTREEYPGTGIGLATCKKIVDRHQGQIWVESEPHQGTTFFFTLPQIPIQG